jgi:hypothetical protein
MLKKYFFFSFFFILLATNQTVFCNPISNNSTTNWYVAGGWTPNGIPDLLIWNGTQDVIVSHNKTANDLEVKNNNSITVTTGAVLTINGDLTMGSRSSLVIEPGAVVIITGSLLVKNSPSTVKVDGTLNVGWNYFVQTSAVTHEHTGLVTVGNNLTVLGNTDMKILGGTVTIANNLKLGNNGAMSGCSGRVTYNSFDIISCGFSYLKCCTGKRGTGCSNIPPPSGGIDFSTCAAPSLCNSIGGTVRSSNSTVCAGSNSGTLNLIGSNGNVVRWEKSTNNWGSTNIIANNTNSLTFSDISLTTKYRAVIRDATCPEVTSSDVTITVDPYSFGGILESNETVCSGINSGKLILGGQIGDIVRWEKSVNNWASKTNIINHLSFQDYNNLIETTKYRAVIKSGACSENFSTEVTISICRDTSYVTVYDTNLVVYNDTIIHTIYDTITTVNVQFDTLYETIIDTNYVDVYDILFVDLTGGVTEVNPLVVSDLMVRVYPNPATQLLLLEVLNTEATLSYTFELINLNGQIIMSRSALNKPITTIDLSSYPTGTFYIKFYNNLSKTVNQVPIVIRK